MLNRLAPMIWREIAPGLKPPDLIMYGTPGEGNDGECSLTRYKGCHWTTGYIAIVVCKVPQGSPVPFVLAHELAHAMHWRTGIDTTENEADRVAHEVCGKLNLCRLIQRREGPPIKETWAVMYPSLHMETFHV
jgi:hypothetical protein